MRQQRTVRRMVGVNGDGGSGVVLLGIGIAPGVASAHTPIVSGKTAVPLDVSFTS